MSNQNKIALEHLFIKLISQSLHYNDDIGNPGIELLNKNRLSRG
jgi:hypothetical protein